MKGEQMIRAILLAAIMALLLAPMAEARGSGSARGTSSGIGSSTTKMSDGSKTGARIDNGDVWAAGIAFAMALAAGLTLAVTADRKRRAASANLAATTTSTTAVTVDYRERTLIERFLEDYEMTGLDYVFETEGIK